MAKPVRINIIEYSNERKEFLIFPPFSYATTVLIGINNWPNRPDPARSRSLKISFIKISEESFVHNE